MHDLAQGQNQIQNALQQILSMLPNAGGTIPTPTSASSFLPSNDGGVPTSSIFPQNVSPPSIFNNNTSPGITYNRPSSPQNTATGRGGSESLRPLRQKDFPKLPGFAPPVGIVSPELRGQKLMSRTTVSVPTASSLSLPLLDPRIPGGPLSRPPAQQTILPSHIP